MKFTLLIISPFISLSLAASAIGQTEKEQPPGTSGATTAAPAAKNKTTRDADEQNESNASGKNNAGTMPNPGATAGKFENEMDEVKERMKNARERQAARENEAAQSPGAKETRTASPQPSASALATASASASPTPGASISLTPAPSPR